MSPLEIKISNGPPSPEVTAVNLQSSFNTIYLLALVFSTSLPVSVFSTVNNNLYFLVHYISIKEYPNINTKVNLNLLQLIIRLSLYAHRKYSFHFSLETE